MQFHPVILCGGAGTRLWPASRNERPKQFVRLLGPHSLFQETALRLAGLEAAGSLLVVAGEVHAGLVERQLAELGLTAELLLEPEGRDSAAALAASAVLVVERDSDGVVVAVASDHHIPDGAAFLAAVAAAGEAAARGAIVAFGVEPTEPATAYGYIQPGEPLDGAPGVRRVRRFVEKPDEATARGYLADGYLWNSGNFVFGARALVEELDRFAPEVMGAVRRGLSEAAPADGRRRLGPSFLAAPKVSIDYAVMEKTDRAAVAPVRFAWSDVGAWEAVRAVQADGSGNAVRGDVVLVDSRDSLVRAPAEGPLVVGVGLRGIGVVVEPDAILICDLAASQTIKRTVDRLKADSRRELNFGLAAPDLAGLTARFERWLTTSALPLWWALGADHAGGGFHEALDDQGRPVAADRRARVQARQTYVYAVAGMLGWAGPWQAAVEHGLDYLFGRYLRPDGLLRTLVHADGRPADDTAMLYDQAFGLLALAAAAQAMPDRRLSLSAMSEAIAAALAAERAHIGGGFTEAGGGVRFVANPHMHLLEAALAWAELDPGGRWNRLADDLVELCLARFIDGAGALHESFGADWRLAPGEAGRIVEPGHQFEWAWLLERWSRLRGRPDAHAAAARLFEVGALGVDRARGGVAGALLDDLATVHDPVARLWPHTERIKAGLILAEAEGDRDRRRRYLDAVEDGLVDLWRYFQTGVAGAWRDKIEADGAFRDEPAPASSLYHIVCAFKALRESGLVGG